MSRQIRRITIGNSPMDKGLSYQVGNYAISSESGYTISSIIQNGNILALLGVKRYEVYIEDKDKNEYMWKAVENMPVVVEYKLPSEVDEITLN